VVVSIRPKKTPRLPPERVEPNLEQINLAFPVQELPQGKRGFVRPSIVSLAKDQFACEDGCKSLKS